MATVVFSLPDNLVEYGTEKGVFSPEWVGNLVRDELIKLAKSEPCPPGFPQELRGIVAPKQYGSVKTHGDIIGPFHEEWGTKQ